MKHILHPHKTYFIPQHRCCNQYPLDPRERYTKGPQRFQTALTIYKRQITVILTSKVNVTETQKMGLFISSLPGELAAPKNKFFNALKKAGKDNCSKYIDFQ